MTAYIAQDNIKEDMAKKKFTIDDLAVMVKKGFDQTATKEELRAITLRLDGLEKKVGGLDQKVDAGFFAVNRRIDLLHEDISDLPAMREELIDLRKRVERVERKVGLPR